MQVLGSTHYPVDSWVLLGNLVAQNQLGPQQFTLQDHSWVRFLKIRFLSHHGKEHYCTVTSLQVHGVNYMEDLQYTMEGQEGTDEDEATDLDDAGPEAAEAEPELVEAQFEEPVPLVAVQESAPELLEGLPEAAAAEEP